jgi:type IX secretion system PorP/SprF family membrane protein
MMSIKRALANRVFLGILGLLVSATVYGQKSLNHSQYKQNPGSINPTWYLSDSSASVHGIVRTQWLGMEGAPSTYGFNGHVPLKGMGSAIGMNLSHDSFGLEKLTDVSAFFAKSVQLSQSGQYLSASLNLGVRRYIAQYSGIDPMDPVFRDDVQETVGTVGLGVMFYEPERFFVGFSLPRLSMQELGIASNRRDYHFNATYYLMGGYLARLNEVFKLKPAFLVSTTKGLPNTYDLSTTLYMQDAIGVGLSYGTSRELGAHASVYVSNRLIFSYNYQFSTEAFGGINIGNNTHEIGVTYRFGEGIRRKLL